MIKGQGNSDLLLDTDLSRRWGFSLRHNNAKDAVLQTGFHGLLVDSSRKRESSMELANRALGDPIFGCVLGVICDFGVVDLGQHASISMTFVVRLRGLILHSGVLVTIIDFGTIIVLNEPFRFGAGLLMAMLRPAGNGESIPVSPFDVDILLIDARKLTMEFVPFF